MLDSANCHAIAAEIFAAMDGQIIFLIFQVQIICFDYLENILEDEYSY